MYILCLFYIASSIRIFILINPIFNRYELQIFGNPEKLCLNDYFGHFIFLLNENFDKSLSASAIDKM